MWPGVNRRTGFLVNDPSALVVEIGCVHVPKQGSSATGFSPAGAGWSCCALALATADSRTNAASWDASITPPSVRRLAPE